MLEALRPLVAPDALLTGDAAAPWAVHGVRPAAVVLPGSAEQAAGVLWLASREGWITELAGTGTRLGSGRPAGRLDLVVSSLRLDAVAEYEPADLTAAVGAGMALTRLGQVLGENRQWLPLEPRRPGGTLGGAVAAGSAGPLRLGYGTPRDHVLGLQLVTGDGRVLALGGRVVKNVAGYDLVRLITGSRGTLGLITRMNIRLRPLPAADRSVLLRAPDPAALVTAVKWIREARIEPVALELLSPTLAAGLAGAAPPAGWALLVRLQGNSDAVAAAARELETLRDLAPVRPLDPGDAERAWSALSAAERDAALVIRLAQLPSALEATLGQALTLAGGSEVPGIAAHAGDGIVRVLVSAAACAARPPAAWAAALDAARSALGGGSAVLEQAPRELAERLEPTGPSAPVLELMQGLRKAFDPAGILAPGRFGP